MTLLRYSRDVYGQQVLEGISWDLLWLFAGLPAAFIVGHLIYSFLRARRSPPPKS